jgi:hypothetical protein
VPPKESVGMKDFVFNRLQERGMYTNPDNLILLQISIHLQQMGKIGPFGKSKKVFWHIQNGQKGFLELKRTSFQTKT